MEEQPKEDFLEVDSKIPGQNYVCLSFVSPEKTLKQKEDSVKYKPRKSSYFEIFKDMDGNKKTILTEDLTKE